MYKRQGIGYAAGFLDHAFLGFLDKNLIDHPQYPAGFNRLHRASAITGINRGIQLVNPVGIAQAFDHFY